MPNTRKAGRSNVTQNLDNVTPDMNQNFDQNFDQSIQSDDMNDRGTQGTGNNRSQQPTGIKNDGNLGADTDMDNEGGPARRGGNE